MKKIFLFLPFLIIGLSCNSFDDIPDPDEENEIELKEIIVLEETIPERIVNGEYSFLGVSYDIMSEYLEIGATKRLVVNLKDFLEKSGFPDSFVVNPSGFGYTSMYSGHNAISFLESLTSKTEVKVNLGEKSEFLNFRLSSKSLNFSDNINEDDSYSYARVDIIRGIKQVKFWANPSMLQSYVYPEFLDDLDKYTPDEFVKEYGTHVLLNVSIGDRFQFNFRSKLANEYSDWEKKRIVEAGILTAVSKFGTPGGIFSSETGKDAVRNTKWNTNVRYRKDANSYVALSYGYDTETPTTPFVNPGEGFLDINNAVIVEIDWQYAYPISDFIADSVKRDEIESAIKRYITQTK
jgi:hypothetical protein